MFAQSFDEEFKAWSIDGFTSSAVYTVIVLAVVALVLFSMGRSSR